MDAQLLEHLDCLLIDGFQVPLFIPGGEHLQGHDHRAIFQLAGIFIRDTGKQDLSINGCVMDQRGIATHIFLDQIIIGKLQSIFYTCFQFLFVVADGEAPASVTVCRLYNHRKVDLRIIQPVGSGHIDPIGRTHCLKGFFITAGIPLLQGAPGGQSKLFAQFNSLADTKLMDAGDHTVYLCLLGHRCHSLDVRYGNIPILIGYGFCRRLLRRQIVGYNGVYPICTGLGYDLRTADGLAP